MDYKDYVMICMWAFLGLVYVTSKIIENDCKKLEEQS